MHLTEIAKSDAERLRSELPSATVSVDGVVIRLTHPGRMFAAECTAENSYLVGYEEPPSSNGFQVGVRTQQRVTLNRAEMIARANQWGRRQA